VSDVTSAFETSQVISDPDLRLGRLDFDENPDRTDLTVDARRAVVTMLMAAATEFDCRSSLEVGPVRADVTTAMAELHHARGYGQHSLIAGDEAVDAEGAEPAAWGARVRRLAQPAEIALPALLASGAELDFAVLVIGQHFDTAFRDFLYVDRMLCAEGLLVLDRGTEPATMSALAEYVSQARAYEERSPSGSAVMVLRKLGGQPAARSVLPARWCPVDPLDEPVSGAARRAASGPRAGVGPGALRDLPTLDIAPNRELHLSRSRACEMELRIAELGARLFDAEQRAGELLRTQRRLTEVEPALRASQVQVQELRERCDAEVEAHDRTRAQLADAQAGRKRSLRGKLRGRKRRLRARIGQ